MDRFLVPDTTYRCEIEIKRSRFITSIGNVDGRSEAKQFVQAVRSEFPDANHHCWAMVAGRPDDVYQQDQSDDGEPKGTAGKPMLNVLQHSGLGNTVAVVTRYFGGVKLGAGGLVRAYTQSISEAIKSLSTRERFIGKEVCVALPYSQLDSFEHGLLGSHISIKEKSFSDTVSLILLVPDNQAEQLASLLTKLGVHDWRSEQ